MKWDLKLQKLYSFRGSYLNDLEYYFDAIEDYNKFLSINPSEGVASGYYEWGMIKHSIFDIEVSRADLITAITLSKIDNKDNRYWNEHAKSSEFGNSATEVYQGI